VGNLKLSKSKIDIKIMEVKKLEQLKRATLKTTCETNLLATLQDGLHNQIKINADKPIDLVGIELKSIIFDRTGVRFLTRALQNVSKRYPKKR
jgi:hypothetical protein